jgi:hypothetical protein
MALSIVETPPMPYKFFVSIALAALVTNFNCVASADDGADTWTASPTAVEAASKRMPDYNFAEEKAGTYTLPDPLVAADGSRVTKETWPARRAELLEMFRREVYGRAPVDRPKNMSFTIVEEDPHDLDGRATRSLIEISFDTPYADPFAFRVQLYVPNATAKPVPALVFLNFQGLTDKETPAIIDRGYALAILDRTQLAADDPKTYREGIINAFSGADELASDAWQAFSAWAWGASRVLDYLITDPAIDARRIGVVGFSRMAKTALWAGATDERFAIVFPNESGCGGAALSKRDFGETVARINTKFPHWFCQNFQRYNGHEADMPFDQHELVALVAPRPIYVTSADEDLWSDPRGEFLGCAGADPVYRLLGVEGLATNHMPPLEQPVTAGLIGYHIRRGPHGLTDYDWQRFVDFANLHLKPPSN